MTPEGVGDNQNISHPYAGHIPGTLTLIGISPVHRHCLKMAAPRHAVWGLSGPRHRLGKPMYCLPSAKELNSKHKLLSPARSVRLERDLHP